MSLQSIINSLNSVSAAVQTVESAAVQTQSVTGAPVTGAQKLASAVALVSAVSPNAAAVLGPLEAIIAGLVAMFNSFGLFSHSGPTKK